jgi:hypothetical protein
MSSSLLGDGGCSSAMPVKDKVRETQLKKEKQQNNN